MTKKTVVFLLTLTLWVVLGAKQPGKRSYGVYGGWSVPFDNNQRTNILYDLYYYDRVVFHNKNRFGFYLGCFYQWNVSPKSSLQLEVNYQEIIISRAATYYKDDQVVADYPWSSYSEHIINILFNYLYKFKETKRIEYFFKAGVGPGFRNLHLFGLQDFRNKVHLNAQIGLEIHINSRSKKRSLPIILGAALHYLTYREGWGHKFGGAYACFYLGTRFK